MGLTPKSDDSGRVILYDRVKKKIIIITQSNIKNDKKYIISQVSNEIVWIIIISEIDARRMTILQ